MENPKLLEAQIIYSIIFNPNWIDEFLTLEEKDFLYYPHLYQTIKKIKEEGKHLDYSLVYSLNKQVDEAILTVVSEDNLGMTIIPSLKIFEERVETLKEISLKRQIEEAGVNQLDLALLKEKLEHYHKKGQARWLTGEDIRNLAYEILKNKQKSSVTYNLHLLDKVTGGIERGQYIIVAGRPSVGKSAFLQFIGLKNAQKNKKVLFVSAEMSEEMIVKRILSTYQPEEIPKTFNILNASTTETIDAQISKKARDFDLVLVDYIQLLKTRKIISDMYERVTEVSATLKTMASKYNLPFVCASQFSRRAEGRQPTLADLKESGALEQDADVVISLWVDQADKDFFEERDKTKVRIDLLKNRNGWTFQNTDTKEFSLIFIKNRFEFLDVVDGYEI